MGYVFVYDNAVLIVPKTCWVISTIRTAKAGWPSTIGWILVRDNKVAELAVAFLVFLAITSDMIPNLIKTAPERILERQSSYIRITKGRSSFAEGKDGIIPPVPQ